MDKEGKSALFHCLHPTGRHAKCMGFVLECGVDPNTRVRKKNRREGEKEREKGREGTRKEMTELEEDKEE